MTETGMIGRTYLERGAPVVVVTRWITRPTEDARFTRLDGTKPRGTPRNVLIRRADGLHVVRPFRGLRKPPTPTRIISPSAGARGLLRSSAMDRVADETRAKQQIAQALACGELRTCQDCGARVPYAFSQRNWHTYPTRCGKETFRPGACPEGYIGDRWPYSAGVLEAMAPDALMREMDRAYGAQASVVDNGGSDDASYRAERRCDQVERELKSRSLQDAYWARRDGLDPLPPTDQSAGGGR